MDGDLGSDTGRLIVEGEFRARLVWLCPGLRNMPVSTVKKFGRSPPDVAATVKFSSFSDALTMVEGSSGFVGVGCCGVMVEEEPPASPFF